MSAKCLSNLLRVSASPAALWHHELFEKPLAIASSRNLAVHPASCFEAQRLPHDHLGFLGFEWNMAHKRHRHLLCSRVPSNGVQETSFQKHRTNILGQKGKRFVRFSKTWQYYVNPCGQTFSLQWILFPRTAKFQYLFVVNGSKKYQKSPGIGGLLLQLLAEFFNLHCGTLLQHMLRVESCPHQGCKRHVFTITEPQGWFIDLLFQSFPRFRV